MAQVASVGGSALDADVAQHLVSVYGTRAADVARLVREDPSLGERLVEGRAEILAQVDWAVREEMASEVEDVMVRRTQLFYRDVQQGLTAVATVADRMALLLGWTPEQRATSAREYEAEVALARQWRHAGEEAAAEVAV